MSKHRGKRSKRTNSPLSNRNTKTRRNPATHNTAGCGNPSAGKSRRRRSGAEDRRSEDLTQNTRRGHAAVVGWFARIRNAPFSFQFATMSEPCNDFCTVRHCYVVRCLLTILLSFDWETKAWQCGAWLLVTLFAVSFGHRAAAQTPSYKVLIFSATAGFRHDSITNGIQTIQMLAATNNFSVDTTEDATQFTDANLAQYKAIIFLSTTGDVLTNAQQQAALQHYIEAGGGYVGTHAAADTLHNWPWYGGLVGAYFVSHPAIQQATVKVADRVDPSSSMLPKRWVRTDEWYNFATNPRVAVHVVATLDETTYSGGTLGYDHPIAWSQIYD